MNLYNCTVHNDQMETMSNRDTGLTIYLGGRDISVFDRD